MPIYLVGCIVREVSYEGARFSRNEIETFLRICFVKNKTSLYVIES